MFVEVVLRARFKSIDTVSQKDLVAIHGEDLLFGKAALDLQRQHGFLDLSAKVPFRR